MALVISAEGASGNELSTTMMVLGIWAQKGSAGQKVLENLGINDEKIAELGATVSISYTFLGVDYTFCFILIRFLNLLILLQRRLHIRDVSGLYIQLLLEFNFQECTCKPGLNSKVVGQLHTCFDKFFSQLRFCLWTWDFKIYA